MKEHMERSSDTSSRRTISPDGYRLGIDIGSTTVKLVATDPATGKILYSHYERHNARQTETLVRLLMELGQLYPSERFLAAVCGSGGRTIAERLGVHFIQEVVANSAAVRELYPRARTAVELGGQDAKVVFFYYDKKEERLQTSDMRMNGSCAGGTGAFIDEIAALLHVKPEEFDALAAEGTTVYEISGRCGVFAKTDIQPLLLSGARKEDIALATFHAIAKQTIGGLAQGLELRAPVVFEGGPLTFNRTLIRVFQERLGLSDEEIMIPDHPETIVAYGTAIAIDQLFPGEEEKAVTLSELLERLRSPEAGEQTESGETEAPFFRNEAEREEFTRRHDRELMDVCAPKPVLKPGEGAGAGDVSEAGGKELRVYIGIDSGSTTSKIVLVDEENRVIDRFYANNNGEPLKVVKSGLLGLWRKYEELGLRLKVLGLGTTGYGEAMMARAFGADYHTVETVAHSYGCCHYYPDTSFLLDIGGQDMKAIWLKDGVITNIMLNEACSSGCGSFLENFASNLEIPVEGIEDAAFRSKNPAKLGSRCTVFMNSTIITEQRNGRTPDDIMAGLCRSIIENVFTKVVRIADVSELGEHICVQGGTFRNRAVLKALEDYLGVPVRLAPYPGEMGAIGAALAARQYIGEHGYANGTGSSFIGFAHTADFSYSSRSGVLCEGCANHCSRTVISFSTGQKWISGNRCEKGAQEQAEKEATKKKIPDLFVERERMLFADYPYEQVSTEKDQAVGLPRVLEFWDSMPFWSTFFRALGYRTVFSHRSSRKLYEQGLKYVASDTVCFPAKLVHGHIMDLEQQGVERIFFPYIMHTPPEGVDRQSPYMCSVLQGYPMVVRNSQNPGGNGIIFDTPIFHWFTAKNRKKQICSYAIDTLGVTEREAKAAFAQGEKAIESFRLGLQRRGQEILDAVHENNSYAVVLAGRPYHGDPFVCHDIYRRFEESGVPVLTLDSLPGLSEQDLHNTVVEITNNFHTRMLEGAMLAAKDPALEYVQIVSFGCGHDAILSDEITRILHEMGHKPPLILKVDESDAAGSLGIRIRSFLETIAIRRRNLSALSRAIDALPEPSPAKFHKADRKTRTLLIPNISREVSVLLCGICAKEGYIVKSVPVGGTEEIRLGKRYVHNDICFPAQMVIGELIGELQKGNYRQDEVAVGMVKFQCDCRMSHYAGLLRKGLDRAGFTEVPIVTTDAGDSKNMHPGVYLLGISAVLEAVWCFLMLDILTELVRKIRPYEIHPGETNRVYEDCVEKMAEGIQSGIGHEKKVFDDCLDRMDRIPYDRSNPKPRVFITGELLVTYHPGSNFHIEEYMEANGMETIFPRITDQLRKDFRASLCEIRDYGANIPPYPYVVDALFDHVQKQVEKIAARHPLCQKALNPKEMYRGVSDIIPETLSCGEGWLMAAEIAHYAQEGVKSFIILQPFGCLPNHVCGRGTIKALKERYPDISILPLDLDPDTSYANVENRMQMLIMNH
ncbi:MAG: acyl-CoA dehydratase activase [Lachnospiraceae bacterium]|nr:acyl-CoA dehydratase activase [Lachnospiraceae bacterium]